VNPSREEVLLHLATEQPEVERTTFQSASRRRAEAALWRAAQAEGLAHSKTWRTCQPPRHSRSVLPARRSLGAGGDCPPSAVMLRRTGGNPLPLFASDVLRSGTKFCSASIARELAGFGLARRKPADGSESDRLQMSFDPVLKRRQHLSHMLHAFTHPVPLDLKTIAVVDNMPEATEGAELTRQRLVEQHGQRRMAGWAEPLEQILPGHKSTRARFSMSRVNGVGGSSGTRSSGTPIDSSSAADNSNNFQPGTPAHARSRSRACAGFSSALPNSSSRVAPNWRATRTTFVRTFSRSVIARKLSPLFGTDNDKLFSRLGNTV